jgi:hypothetical protein
MFTLIGYFVAFVAGVLGHAYAYPFLANAWSKVVAWFKKEESEVFKKPTTPTPTVTPTVSG